MRTVSVIIYSKYRQKIKKRNYHKFRETLWISKFMYHSFYIIFFKQHDTVILLKILRRLKPLSRKRKKK